MRALASVAIALLAAGATLTARASAGVLPPGMQTGPESSSGVYAGDDAGSCCWLGRTAEVTLAPSMGARKAVVKIFIPEFALPAAARESIVFRVDGGTPVSFCCLERGYHELDVPLSADGAQVRMTIAPSHAFVPARAGISPDNRALTVLLRAIEFPAATAPWWIYAAFFGAFAVAAALTFLRPVFAPCLLLLTAPVTAAVPLAGTAISLPTAVLLGCIVSLAAARPWLRVRVDRYVFAFAAAQIALLAVLLASQLHSPSPFGTREDWKALQTLGVFAAAYFGYRADPDRNVLYGAVFAVTGAACIVALLQLAGAAPQERTIAGLHLGRVAGFFDGPNQLCGFLGMTLPVLVASLRDASRVWRILASAAVCAGAVAATMTLSRGGLLALAVTGAVAAVVFVWPQHKRLAAVGAASVFAVLFGLSLLAFGGSPRTPQAIFGAPHSFNGGLGTRTTLYYDAYRLWRESPLLGIGPGNFELRVGDAGTPGLQTHANSLYFQALCETGVVGLAVWALLTWLPLRTFFRHAADPLVAALFAASAGLAAHQVVDDLLFYPKIAIVWFALLGAGYAAAGKLAARRHLRNG